MKYTLYMLLLVVSTFICSCINKEEVASAYKKYDIPTGKIVYQLSNFMSEETMQQTVYFSDYGATEYMENSMRQKTLRMLKQDSLQYILLPENMVIKTNRTFDNVAEKSVLEKNSKLFFEGMAFMKKKDTVFLGKKCELYIIKDEMANGLGKGIFYKKIPLYIEYTTDGLPEKVKALRIEINIKIPDSLKKLDKKYKLE